MNVSTFFPTLKKLIKRASSLLMIFQRTPAAQILVPAEFNLASSAAFLSTAEFAIATVVGLGAYDSVAGATTISLQNGSLNGVVGQSFSATFQVTGSESPPQSWSVASTTPLPSGLSISQIADLGVISGTPTAAGNTNVTLKAWEGASLNGNVVQKNITISISAPAVASITTNPASTTINSGQTATLTVVAAGQNPLTYQWYQGASGDTSLPVGTDSASFTTPVLTSTTSYWVKVTNSLNTTGANSTTATVTVRQPAAITTQPVSTSIVTGQTTLLSVTASGTGPLTYQWYQGTSPSEATPVGTNSPNFTTPTLLATTSYWVKVTNTANPIGVKSQTATVTVTEATDPGIFTASPLPAARTNIPYNTTLTAFGGRKPYVWSITDGSLPDGLILSETGEISGTSGSVGTATFTVQVMDQDMKTDTRVFELLISDLAIATTTLPTGVKGTPYSATLTASGGSEPFTWTLQGGALPAGITLSSAGVLSGTPTAAGDVAIVVRVTDFTTFAISKALLLPVSATFTKPVVNPITFPVVTVGTDFRHTVTALNYPKTFTITGLPKGLKFVAATGAITGQPDVSGVFNVQVKAANSAGTSLVVTSRLTVKALPKNLVGTFGGILTRNITNRSLGGQIGLTITSNGTYTLKVTGALPSTTLAQGGAASSSATGRLAATAPQIITTMAGAAVSLSIDPANGDLSGSVGAASISGHRSVWNALANPAEHLAGYYSMALDLKDAQDKASPTIPQGSGFAIFSVNLAGSLTAVGKTADGEAITSSSFLGAHGESWVYSTQYKKFGTIQGPFQLSKDAQNLFAGNSVSGSLTWLKPDTTPTPFGPINVLAEGGYLAPSSTGNVILGLPEAGSVLLNFAHGGLEASATNPNLSFTFTADNKVVLPLANPNKVAVSINPNTGVVGGNFTLTETTPPLVRAKVPFQGQIVRLANGQIKAVGYFLLPQIPAVGQAPAAVPVLSGAVSIETSSQPPASNFPIATIGSSFSHTVVASNNPKTFTFTGLPKGLKPNPATGEISGIPVVSGVYNVQVKATNAAGVVELISFPLVVKALPSNHVGTFGGLIARDPVNHDLGGMLTVTTTSTGGYTIKLVGTSASGAAAASYASTGFMLASAPQISVTIGGHLLALTFNATTGEMTGSHGTATVQGWRSAWNILANPADKLAGYYSMAVDLADLADDNVASIPQGTGFATFSVSLGGSLILVGKTADGEAITTASFLAANGDFWAHTALYKSLGSIQGPLNLSEDAAGLFAGNTISGSMTWYKPTNTSRAYKDTFGPINLKAEGGYLAPASTGSIVLGLPETGNVQLSFTDGGLASSVTNPDISFTYTSDNKVLLPLPVANPAKVAVTINPNTGVVAGNFTLTETSPPLTRAKVPFQGQVVRLADGQTKAVGYFLLPQIPGSGQTAATAPLLSGGVWLQQSLP